MMGENKNSLHHFRDPSAKLTKALETLEAFTRLNASEPIPHIFHHQKEGSAFKRLFSLARCFLAATFFEKVRKQNESQRGQAQRDVWNAIDDVKRYHPLIRKKNNAEEKRLIRRLNETIGRYNQMMENFGGSCSNWHKRLFCFLIKKSRLSLTETEKIQLPSTKISQKASAKLKPMPKRIAALIGQNNLPHTITNRVVDAFRMKAISLMQNHGLPFSSIAEALNFVQESPIYTTISRDAKKGNVSASSVISLQQTITPFPGETIILRGAFRRNPQALSPITPIPESFELSRSSVQTGFPYPSQYSGWALSDVLIPSHPHRLDQLEQLPLLLKKKYDIAQKFMGRDRLLDKAQKLLANKKNAVEENQKSFLSLHKKLCFAMISSAPKDVLVEDIGNLVLAFFDWLEKQPSPLTTLSEVYHEINRKFIIEPYQALQNIWIQQSSRDLLSDNSSRSYFAARQILQRKREQSRHQLENATTQPSDVVAFQAAFGKIVGGSCQQIILQYMSELMEFSPPELSPFEKKILSATFYQLEGFFEELEEEDLSQQALATIEQYLKRDIDLFQSQTMQHPIVLELENYYQSRFNPQLSRVEQTGEQGDAPFPADISKQIQELTFGLHRSSGIGGTMLTDLQELKDNP
ncbi:MAG: hypothetical protein WB791_03360 [Waddliaceae bacterium]